MTQDIQATLWRRPHKLALAGLLGLQLAIAYILGKTGVLANAEHSIFPPIAVAVVVPVAGFILAYVFSTRFRNFVLAHDIVFLTRLQQWRVVGSMFIALYFFDVLPALFAWPAGYGDLAVGIMAAIVVTRLERNPDYVFSKGFLAFHLFGLLDFIGALVTSGLASGAFPALVPNGVTSAPLDVWPLNLFPSLIVPGFIILQLSALLKLRELRAQQATPTALPA